MNDFTAHLAILLVRELKSFQRELDLFPDDETAWKTVPGVTNSAANLALHLVGNLQHFVGGLLGASGYVRNRELEFSRASGTRAEIKDQIDGAIRTIEQVIPNLGEELFARPFPSTLVPGKEINTALFLQHLCSHAAFHLGQAGYLRRVLTGDSRSAGPVLLGALTTPSAG